MTDILTRLAALREHSRTSELREHIRRGYGFRAVGAERIWSLHEDEMQVLNTGFTCLDDRCKSLIALVQDAADEFERQKRNGFVQGQAWAVATMLRNEFSEDKLLKQSGLTVETMRDAGVDGHDLAPIKQALNLQETVR